ncbi:holo-ACP synthase [Corynebacterium sp.]|uniref:holo-ACP synthase AcpS n=1 Tax=Corynebacterium sp. TaxID=1720 RepID=UPI0026DB73F1|nr:holo-ACP synthase [Corynebacterium sp.]MDO5032932.1 holo-ACP synthase [Corynebacterium sp.]
MSISVGTDLVHIPAFAAQLEVPGTRFARVFSAAELRVAASKGARRAEHLAGRWALKEAFLKAWAQARYGSPPVLAEEDLDWSEIEVRPDAWGRVAVSARGEVARLMGESLGRWDVGASLSHDGEYATATVILTVL